MRSTGGLLKPELLLHFLLLICRCCSRSSAFVVPSVSLCSFGGTSSALTTSTSTMAGVRRRTGEGVPSKRDKHDATSGMGMVLGKDKKNGPSRRGSSPSPTRRMACASSFGSASRPAPSSEVGADSVIHLGKLRIPDSRRINLARRVAGDSDLEVAVSDIAPLEDTEETSEDTQREENWREERWESDRKIAVNAERLMKAHSITDGGPSVIPYGMSDRKTKRVVVQIPLEFTVMQTVDFIRAVSTADREGKSSPGGAMTGGARRSRLLRGDDRLTPALTDRIYVTEGGKLKGYITMAALIINEPQTPVSHLVRELEEKLKEGDSWEDAAKRLRQTSVMAAPVVDDEGVLVAVLNPSDLLMEMEIEATDDIMRRSGSGGGESYFGTPLSRLVASRVGWLVGLLGLQSFSSLILQSFQSVIERNIVIALFLTMLTGTAGNAGNQSSAIVIRGLATGEIHQGNKFRVIWREARAAVASAVVLSAASFVRVFLTPGATTVATSAVSIAMGATVIGAVMFGTIAPIVLHGLGIDPVNFASPALATLTDVSGVFILCSVAKLLLGSAP